MSAVRDARTGLRGGMPALLAGLLVFGAATWPGPGDAAKPRKHVVEIRSFAFETQGLRVARGDTVVWVNRDIVPHTVTAADHAWDSGRLAPGASWTLVAGGTGETPYYCVLHPAMKSTLVVR